jgi:membrane fusion protein (multidrug efflux system)
MKKKIFIAIGIVAAIFVGLAGIKFLQIHKMIAFGKTFVPPPETISSAVAHEENWQDSLTAVGSIDPQSGVTLASEVVGTVTEIAVADGTVVAKGDLLLRLDTSSEEAQLRSLESQVAWAKISAERLRTLRTNNTVAQSELDQAEAALQQSEANADVVSATIAKKTIRAPFAGRLGIWRVNVGASLDARAPIVSLQSLTPVYADFSLPQQNLAQLKTGLPVQVTTDAYPDQKFSGILTALNPDLDATTRSVALRATFENTNQLLRPGMFVRAEVVLPQAQPVLAIPATAILSAPYGDSVFVIEQTNSTFIARQQFVRIGQTHGDFVSVLSGLKAGDRVVSAGLFKLRNGVPVSINDDITPKPSKVPNPSDS